jgi:hypothetical protein
MALVSFTPLLDGSLSDPDAVYKSFYHWGEHDSFEEINGRLTRENLNLPQELVDYTAIQRHAVSGGGMVGGTANLDFFGGPNYQNAGFFQGVTFSQLENATSTSSPRARHLAIPGASIQFFLPYKAWVLLTWQIVWVNDSDHSEHTSNVRLFVDDAYTGNGLTVEDGGVDRAYQTRRVTRTMFTKVGSVDDALRDRYKSRYWSGHHFIQEGLGQGWHSASLRLLAVSYVKQTRIRVRNMKYIFFHYGDGGDLYLP